MVHRRCLRPLVCAACAGADAIVRSQVGKSTLIKSLVKHYTRHNLSSVKGPITVVSGKQRRIQLVECGPELNNMARMQLPRIPGQPADFLGAAQIDAAKFADLVLLLVDGNFGFEMETFEFLNILQVSGAAERHRATSADCYHHRCTASRR